LAFVLPNEGVTSQRKLVKKIETLAVHAAKLDRAAEMRRSRPWPARAAQRC
jgi:hypothetical protein